MKVCQRKKRKTENEKKWSDFFEILFPKLEKLITISVFLIFGSSMSVNNIESFKKKKLSYLISAADSAIWPFDSNPSANSATTYLFFHWPYY